MPRKGYKSFTVKKKVYAKLEKIATNTNPHRTIPEVIEFLIEKSEMEA